jgi:hypothetical protein
MTLRYCTKFSYTLMRAKCQTIERGGKKVLVVIDCMYCGTLESIASYLLETHIATPIQTSPAPQIVREFARSPPSKTSAACNFFCSMYSCMSDRIRDRERCTAERKKEMQFTYPGPHERETIANGNCHRYVCGTQTHARARTHTRHTHTHTHTRY